MMERKVGDTLFYLDPESPSLQWLGAFLSFKKEQALNALIVAKDEKDADKSRGRILLCNELMKELIDN